MRLQDPELGVKANVEESHFSLYGASIHIRVYGWLLLQIHIRYSMQMEQMSALRRKLFLEKSHSTF